MSQQPDNVNSVYAQFSKKDKVINELFNDLLVGTDEFTDDSQSNLKKAISLEFIMMKIRMVVADELNLVKSIINGDTSSIPPTIISAFKKREAHLVSLNSRITDIREDFNSLQKLCYMRV